MKTTTMTIVAVAVTLVMVLPAVTATTQAPAARGTEQHLSPAEAKALCVASPELCWLWIGLALHACDDISSRWARIACRAAAAISVT